MLKSYQFIIQCHRDSIDFINKIIEAYEGLGTVRTIDPYKAVVSIICTYDFIDELRTVINDMKDNHLDLEITKEEQWNGNLH